MIAEMKKIALAIPNTDREVVLQFLQEETVMHIETYDSNSGVYSNETMALLAQLQFSLTFIEQLEKRLNIVHKKKLQDMFVSKPTADLETLEKTLAKLDAPQLVARVEQINNTIIETEARILELVEALKQAEPWKNLTIPRVTLHTPILHHLLSVHVSDDAIITRHIETIPTGVWNEVYRVTEKTSVSIYGELLAHEQDAAHVSEFIQALDAQEVVLPAHNHESLKDYYDHLEQEKRQADKALVKEIQNATEVLPLRTKIMFAYDALLHKIEREKAEEKITVGSFVTVINGWIPTMWLPVFEKKLHKAFPMAALEATNIPQEDRAPVMFQNNKFIRPFEAVTDLYGKPAYHELDPSGPLALFFLISFGLALTDAGYGVIMMIGTFMAERFFKLKKDMQKLVRVLFYAGAVTVVLGGLTGGWFSIDLDKLPEGTIKHFFLGIKVLDPLKQPILLLGIIFLFGIVQLMYAWVVRGIYHWKKGEKSIAIMDDFSWVAMVLSIIAWQICLHIPALLQYTIPATYVMYTVGLFMVATQGRAAKNIFLKIGGGALSLYGLVAFVSDMLSYSRLLALGLATGIIGLVVNLIAGMVWAIPVVGVFAGVIVLIIGHVFNLGINALGAYIHSGRLQFVEFFPKFLEGGGLPFRPFGRVSKYVDNPKDYVT